MKQGYVATLRAAQGAWLAGDDQTAARLADEAAYQARTARDLDAAVEASELCKQASKVLALQASSTGWGTR